MRPDESGVSAVVGAVLLLALFASATTIYTVTTLPEWKADKEQVHQAQVRAELGSLKSDLEALAARREAGPVSATIPLEVPTVPLLQSTPAQGSLGISGSFLAGFSFTSNPFLFFQDDVAIANPDEALGPLCAANGKCVQALRSLEVGLVTTGIDAAADEARITLTIVDSAPTPNTVTATLAHRYVNTGCAADVRLAVGTVTRHVAPCAGSALGASGTPFRVNLLDDDYPLASTVARLAPPLSIQLASSATGGNPTVPTVAGTYAAAFSDSSGILRVVGQGVPTPSPLQPVAGQRIVYSPRYQAYPSQDLVLEGGALLVDAGGAAQAMAVDPSLRIAIDSASGRGSISWTLVQFTGDGTVSGSRDAKVEVRFLGMQDVVLSTSDDATQNCSPCAGIRLTTGTKGGWANHLNLATLAAGTGASATIAQDGTSTTLQLNSGGAGPVTRGWTLHIRLIQAAVEVR